MIKVSIIGQDQKEDGYIDLHPDECPTCHHSMIARPMMFVQISTGLLQGVYQCPSLACHRVLVATFYRSSASEMCFYFKHTLPFVPVEKPVDARLKDISSEFAETYQQSWRAKQLNLTKIAGTGFRRALEFLVKDYATRDQSEEARELILKKPMVQCIKDHIQEEGIKTVAERAAWLGNDESHHLRKWGDKDINDLIDLVDSVGHWIVIHLKTEQLKSTMPHPNAAP
jgi:hypothetical protein